MFNFIKRKNNLIVFDLQLILFKFRKSKLFFALLFFIIYCVFLPVCIYKSLYQEILNDKEVVCFTIMQLFIPVVFSVYINYFLREYIDMSYKENIFYIDISIKYRHFLLMFINFQIFSLPFYIVVSCIIGSMIYYIIIFILILFAILNMYYLLGMLTNNSLLTQCILLSYVLVFTLMDIPSVVGNIFLINYSINDVSVFYYYNIITISLSFILGIILEKRKKKFK